MKVHKLNEELQRVISKSMLEDYDEDIIEYAVNYKDGKSDSFYIVGNDLCLDEQPIDVIEDLNDDNESVRKIIDYVKNNIDKEIKSLEIIEDGVGHTIDFEFVLNFNPKETRKPTEEDLDELYDAKNALNKAEWFVSNEEDYNALYKAQEILNRIINKG